MYPDETLSKAGLPITIGSAPEYDYLDRNYWGITPHFYIKDRIGTSDRAIIIDRVGSVRSGLHFIGVNTPAFAHVPSCFTFLITNLVITNLSYSFIVSEAAGLPFPVTAGTFDVVIDE